MRYSRSDSRPGGLARMLPLHLALACALGMHCAAGADDSAAGLAGFFITNETSALGALLLNARTATGVDYDHDMIDDATEDRLMRKFAPTLYMHPEETSLPASVDWMLRMGGAQMKHNSDNWCKDNLLLDWGQMTALNMGKQVTRGKDGTHSFCRPTNTYYYSHLDYPEDKEFYLRVAERIYPGNLNAAKCYARVGINTRSGSQYKYEIEYWWYYTYQSAAPGTVPGIGTAKAGQHQGDWEHIKIHVDPHERVHSIAYAAHGQPTVYAAADSRLNLRGGFRPDVHAARHTHASYPNEGNHWRVEKKVVVLNDVTMKDPSGTNIIDCASGNRLVNVGNALYTTPGNEWIKYRGAWGTKKDWVGSLRADAGPTGPRMIGINWNKQASLTGPASINFTSGTETRKTVTYTFSPRLATKLGSVNIISVGLTDYVGASVSRSGNRITVSFARRNDAQQETYSLFVRYSIPVDGDPGRRKTLTQIKEINVSYDNAAGCDSSESLPNPMRGCSGGPPDPVEVDFE